MATHSKSFPVAKLVRVTQSLADQIADYRFTHRFNDEAPVIRLALEKGMAAMLAEQRQKRSAA
jgi:hypothetical protein